MKSKYLLLILAGLFVALVINSCKKDNTNPIQTLFTGGTWELASVMAFNYTGDQLESVDTLNETCQQSQFFTFNADNTCTYTNFDCMTQTSAPAHWALTSNQLYLQTNLVCKDTTAAGSSMPFANAAIFNLGQFSLVLHTGDIQPNYSLTKPRRIVEYGFIREKLVGSH
jgi:hypothetical protein